MRRVGARTLPVSAAATLAQASLLGGPLVMCGWSFNNGANSQQLKQNGSVASPGAGASIASISLGNGTYTVEWTVELTGTPGVADVDNVFLHVGAASVAQSSNLGIANDYPQPNSEVTVLSGPLVLKAQTGGAGTVGAIYTVTMTIIPVDDGTATIFDGQMACAFIGMNTSGVDTQYFGDTGILVENGISVLSTLGTISGVIWYYLASDLEHAPPQRLHAAAHHAAEPYATEAA